MSNRPDKNSIGEELDPNATRQAVPVDVRRVIVGGDESKLDSESDLSAAGLLGLPETVAPTRSPLELATGATVGDYEIVRLLGEGGVARVYLARQRSLDRLVALKVSANTGDEGRTLASLEHDHIVQVFAEQVIGSRRLLAMRYVPSVTLARLLELLREVDRARLKGGDLLALVDREIGQPPSVQDARSRNKLTESGFVRACCQIAAGLARALEHAHAQHVLHRDIKPANILFAQSGRALLMDFNIAARNRSPTRERGSPDSDPSLARRATVAVEKCEPATQVFGGTPAYMAPEHLSAMAANTRTSVERVDERSDVFSLGVVFYELLTGRHPFRVMDSRGVMAAALNQMLADRLQGPPAVRSSGLEVSPGLESIIAKCLAADPAGRYQRASELAEDLERFLDDMPLGYADDPSLRERTGKWLRRNPSLRSVVAAVAVVVAIFVAMTAWFDFRRLGEAEEFIAHAEDQFTQGATSAAADTLEEANKLLASRTTVARFFGAETQRAESQKKLQELAKSVSIVLLAEFASLADTARADPEGTASGGQSRTAPAMFIDPLSVFGVLERDDWLKSASFQALDPEDQAQIEEDVTELLLVQSLDTLADAGQMGGFRANMSILNNLTKIPPRHQRTHAIQMLMAKVNSSPSPGRAPAAPPGDWDVFDVYLTGVLEAKEKRDETARLYFKAAAERCKETDRPLKFWAHFQLAECAYRLRSQGTRSSEEVARLLEEAVREYSACIVLRSEFAWSYHNLGLVYHAQEKLAEAAKQFEEAIARDAKLSTAYSNLAAVQVEQGLFDEAEQTCTQAMSLGFRSAQFFYNRGCARAKLGKRAGAIQDFKATLDVAPNFDDARNNLRLLEAASGR